MQSTNEKILRQLDRYKSFHEVLDSSLLLFYFCQKRLYSRDSSNGPKTTPHAPHTLTQGDTIAPDVSLETGHEARKVSLSAGEHQEPREESEDEYFSPESEEQNTKADESVFSGTLDKDSQPHANVDDKPVSPPSLSVDKASVIPGAVFDTCPSESVEVAVMESGKEAKSSELKQKLENAAGKQWPAKRLIVFNDAL
jgi:hypothetical protein